jgi:hypothetical protein
VNDSILLRYSEAKWRLPRLSGVQIPRIFSQRPASGDLGCCGVILPFGHLTRSDLVRILYERARLSSVDVRFVMAIDALEDQGSDVRVAFTDDS